MTHPKEDGFSITHSEPVTQPHYIDREAVEDLCARLDDILVEESPMHPFGCATWEESSRIAIDMAKDFIRRAPTPMGAVAWRVREQPGTAWSNASDPEFWREHGWEVQALAVIPTQGGEGND